MLFASVCVCVRVNMGLRRLFPFLSFCSILLFCAIFGVDPHITFHPWQRVFLCILRVLKVTCNTGGELLSPSGQSDLNTRDDRGMCSLINI